MIKIEHLQKFNASHIEEYETKRYENNEEAPVIFPRKVKF